MRPPGDVAAEGEPAPGYPHAHPETKVLAAPGPPVCARSASKGAGCCVPRSFESRASQTTGSQSGPMADSTAVNPRLVAAIPLKQGWGEKLGIRVLTTVTV